MGLRPLPCVCACAGIARWEWFPPLFFLEDLLYLWIFFSWKDKKAECNVPNVMVGSLAADRDKPLPPFLISAYPSPFLGDINCRAITASEGTQRVNTIGSPGQARGRKGARRDAPGRAQGKMYCRRQACRGEGRRQGKTAMMVGEEEGKDGALLSRDDEVYY